MLGYPVTMLGYPVSMLGTLALQTPRCSLSWVSSPRWRVRCWIWSCKDCTLARRARVSAASDDGDGGDCDRPPCPPPAQKPSPPLHG
eukprot:5579976-Pyramimonas_sp.AAC.1